MGVNRQESPSKHKQAIRGAVEKVSMAMSKLAHGLDSNQNRKSSPKHSTSQTVACARPVSRSASTPNSEISKSGPTNYRGYSMLDKSNVIEDRYGAEAALTRRNILDIIIFRLLEADLPQFGPEIVSPPSSLGLNYGLVDKAKSRVICLGESPLDKMKPNESISCYCSEEEWRAWCDSLSRPLQEIYTDGSFDDVLEISGFSVWWGEAHINNAYGSLPADIPLSCDRAEEYAIFLALFQIKAEVAAHGVENAKYSILTDSQGVMHNLNKWLKLWDRADVLFDWREPAPRRMHRTEIHRVSAGLLWDLRLRGAIVEISYVKAHAGIMGNEIADILAKIGSSTGDTYGPRPALM